MYLTDFQSISMTIIKTGLIGLAVSAVIYAIFALLTRKRFTAPIRTHVLRYIFLTYFVCVLMLTLSSQSADSLDAEANFIPLFSVIYALKSGFDTAQYLIVLNILMFAPMGIFLPCVFKKVDKLYRTVLISLAATLMIEIIQVLLPGRAFDIDDILLNTLGAAIGYALFAVCVWVFKKREQKNVTRFVSLLVLAIIPVFLLVFNLAVGTKEFEYSFNFYAGRPDDIEIQYDGELPDTAEVYAQAAYDPYAEIQELMRIFDIDSAITEDDSSFTVSDGDKKLSQAKRWNRWQYELRNSAKQEADIEEAGLEETAKSVLEEYGLWREGAQLYNIEDDYTDISGNYPDGFALDEDPVTGELIPPEGVIITGKTVSFSIDDGISYWSASVHIDSEGVWRIVSIDSPYEFYREVELISPAEALEALKFTDKCFVGFDDDDTIIIEPDSMTVDNISLTYMDGNNLQYMLPAWKLEGEFFGTDIYDDGTTEMESARGYMIVEAIKQ